MNNSKKQYQKPVVQQHGSVEATTQFLGGSYTEMLFGNDTNNDCRIQGNGFISQCVDIGS